MSGSSYGSEDSPFKIEKSASKGLEDGGSLKSPRSSSRRGSLGSTKEPIVEVEAAVEESGGEAIVVQE